MQKWPHWSPNEVRVLLQGEESDTGWQYFRHMQKEECEVKFQESLLLGPLALTIYSLARVSSPGPNKPASTLWVTNMYG